MQNNVRSIVAVSNGPAVLTKELGARIDAFDEVVRFNDYVTEGFERNIGSKTTIWGRCLEALARTSPPARTILYIPQRWRRKKAARGAELVPEGVGAGLTGRGRWASTGVTIILYLLREFPVVHTYGFLRGEAGQTKAGFRCQYFQPTGRGAIAHHDPAAEAALLRQLVQQGKIVFLDDGDWSEEHYA